MNINVEAVMILSGMISATCMGGVAFAWMMMRRIDREHQALLKRIDADRG